MILLKHFLTALFLLSFSLLYSQFNLDSLLVYNYEFNGNVEDSSPNEFHGNPNNVVFVDDRDGNPNSAAYFNGSNSDIILPNHPDLKPNYPMTFSFWVYLETYDTEDVRLFTNDHVDNTYTGIWISFPPSTGGPAFNIGSGGTFQIGPTTRRSGIAQNAVPLMQWTHVVGVIRGPLDMDIYINCRKQQVNYSGTGGSLAYSNEPGTLGRYDISNSSPPSYFLGGVDDFRLYSRELSTDEIGSLCGTLDTENLEKESSLILASIFPNPFEDKFTISTENDDLIGENFILYNSLGQEVERFNLKSKEQTINVSDFDSGVYYIRFENKDVNALKLIKN